MRLKGGCPPEPTKSGGASRHRSSYLLNRFINQQHTNPMPTENTSTLVVPICAASKSSRSIPYNPETARCLGGGARGRTLAIIYRQLAYWSKYAKWKGSGGRKFFYKSQKELAGELGYSEKTISRAIKALR